MAKRGAPTKYRPEYPDDLIDHMKKGGSIETFGAYLGDKYGPKAAVGKAAVYEWFEKFEEFAEAKEIGVAYSQKFFEDIGNRGMVGQLRVVSTEEIDPETGKVKARKYRTAYFNDRVWKLNMQNRFGWKDKKAHDHSNPDGTMQSIVYLNIPSNGREAVDQEEDD